MEGTLHPQLWFRAGVVRAGCFYPAGLGDGPGTLEVRLWPSGTPQGPPQSRCLSPGYTGSGVMQVWG